MLIRKWKGLWKKKKKKIGLRERDGNEERSNNETKRGEKEGIRKLNEEVYKKKWRLKREKMRGWSKRSPYKEVKEEEEKEKKNEEENE